MSKCFQGKCRVSRIRIQGDLSNNKSDNKEFFFGIYRPLAGGGQCDFELVDEVKLINVQTGLNEVRFKNKRHMQM